MEPLPPAGASALCQLGPRVGRKEQLFPETPSLGSGEGVKWGELLFQEEQGHWKSLTCPPPPRPSCWAELVLVVSFLLDSSPPSSWVRGRSGCSLGSVCLAVSTPAGISPSMLWSLSPGKLSRASPYRNCECGGFQGPEQQVCVCV